MVYLLEVAAFIGIFVSVICLTSALKVDLKGFNGSMPVSDWTVTLHSPGEASSKKALPPGVLIMGNRRRDNLYIKGSGPRTKLYVNVPGLEEDDDNSCVKVTVLSGSIEFAGKSYEKNAKIKLNVFDGQPISFNGKEVFFDKQY